MIEELVKRRKKIGISRRKLAMLMKEKYSEVWIVKVEMGEKRFSKRFLESYKEAIERCESFFKGV